MAQSENDRRTRQRIAAIAESGGEEPRPAQARAQSGLMP